MLVQDSLELFPAKRELESIGMTDADVKFIRCFYLPAVAQHYYEILLNETIWQQDKITLWGKEHLQPRLTAWYGDVGTSYAYSGIRMQPRAWTPTLLKIKSEIESATSTNFNSVLINLYRDQHDSVGWHSDDEPELGPTPIIASLSLGETRTFKFKHKTKKEEKRIAIDLHHGSLLLMRGATQKFWLHTVEKERTHREPRINLTFRVIEKAS